jgi:hypothetical protein
MCLAAVPAGWTVAFTDGIDCPGCGKRLEVSAANRGVAIVVGLAAGLLAWRASYPSGNLLGWVLPIAYATLAFGVVAALVQMFIADLVVEEEEPEPAPAASPGHGGHGHGRHH